jgi:hypothetical protein
MGRVSAEDWEHVVTRDLLPFLGFGIDLKPRGTQFPVGSTGLPDGAYEDLSADVGRLGAEDLLVVPPAAWMVDRLRYRCLCMPLQIAGIGERAAGLWVRALPAPGVRVQVPVNGIAAIQSVADGRRRLLVVTGQGARLAVRYSSDGDAAVDAWTRRVRVRAAGRPSPVPLTASAQHESLEAFLVGRADYGVSVRWRSYAGSGACLLALTCRELVVVRSWRVPDCPWSRVRRTLYVPRRSITGVVSQSRSVSLDSAGTEVRIALGSRRIAAAAAAWLRQMLGEPDSRHVGARPRQAG